MYYIITKDDKAYGSFEHVENANDAKDSRCAEGYARNVLKLSLQQYRVLSGASQRAQNELINYDIEEPAYRIVRVDGSIIWRKAFYIERFLAADAIYKDPQSDAYLSKL